MKINIFKKKKVFKKESFKLSPDIYWRIILGLFLALVVITALFGSYVFSQINQELMLPTDSSNSIKEKGKIEKTQEALDFFSKREEKSKEILNAPASVIDPAL